MGINNKGFDMTICSFILYCLTSPETITVTNILANLAVVFGLVFAIWKFVRYLYAKKKPFFNCTVLENDLYPDILIHDKNTEPAFKDNKITAFYKWITIFSTNDFGNITIKSLTINGVGYYPGNSLLFTSKKIKELEIKISPLMATITKLGPGDAISGYFPFYGDGHINFGLGDYQLELKSVLGKSKPTTITIKKAPVIYEDIINPDNLQTPQAD